VPTGGFRTATWVPGTPAHSWQAVASGGTSIGLKGAKLAAEVLTNSAKDIFLDPQIIEESKKELKIKQGKDFEYYPLLGDRNPPLEYRLNN
jgi:aminobenzoyl-glutamate utilization protein B